MRKIILTVLMLCMLCACSKADEKTENKEKPVETETVEEVFLTKTDSKTEEIEAIIEETVENPVKETESEAVEETENAVAEEKTVDDKEVESTGEVSDSEYETSLNEKIILIDPGHGINSSTAKEPVAPGSSETKRAFVSGTAGKNQTEEELNLAVGMKLKDILLEKGVQVFMTRETHECNLSNVGRAEMGNEICADLVVRIHADGSESSATKGISMLVPSTKYVSDYVYSESKKAGEIILNQVIGTTGANNRGIAERGDMTGFNWSEVPVVLLEMGFMSNREEDALLETDEYQQKIVNGIVSGILKYFEG